MSETVIETYVDADALVAAAGDRLVLAQPPLPLRVAGEVGVVVEGQGDLGVLTPRQVEEVLVQGPAVRGDQFRVSVDRPAGRAERARLGQVIEDACAALRSEARGRLICLIPGNLIKGFAPEKNLRMRPVR